MSTKKDFHQAFTMRVRPEEKSAVFARPSGVSLWDSDQSEGQLSVDVIDTQKEIIVVAPMAGTQGDEIDVYIQHDLLTIKGVRQNPIKTLTSDYIYKECFWGKFSRSVVLPVEVKGEMSRAEFRGGVLTIYIPKVAVKTAIQVKIVEE